MRKSTLLLLIVALFIIGGSIANTLKEKKQIVSTIDRTPSPTVSDTSSPSPSPIPHPVSLPALAEKELAGSAFTVGRILEETTDYTRHYITYKSGDLTISGIMNKPKGNGPFPILILNHGYIDPAVYTNGRGLKREQDYLVKKGYVVVHPDYRNHADSDKDPVNDLNFRLGYIEDSANLVDALKKSDLAYLDKGRVGMLGHSMGGGVTMGVLVTHPDLVKAAALFAPISASAKENFDRYTAERTDLAKQIEALYDTPESNPKFWKNISFENFFSKVSVPVLVHHGTSDESTPLRWSEAIVDNLKKNGKTVTFHVYPGEPHEFTGAWPTVMQRTTDFFKASL